MDTRNKYPASTIRIILVAHFRHSLDHLLGDSETSNQETYRDATAQALPGHGPGTPQPVPLGRGGSGTGTGSAGLGQEVGRGGECLGVYDLAGCPG